LYDEKPNSQGRLEAKWNFLRKTKTKQGYYPRAPKGIKKAFTAFEGINPSRDNSLEGVIPSKANQAFFIPLGAFIRG